MSEMTHFDKCAAGHASLTLGLMQAKGTHHQRAACVHRYIARGMCVQPYLCSFETDGWPCE